MRQYVTKRPAPAGPLQPIGNQIHYPPHLIFHRHRFSTPVSNPSDPNGLFAYMRRHLDYLEAKGHTNAGLYNSERYVRAFIRWCEPRGLTRPIQISEQDIEQYQFQLAQHRKDNGERLSVFSQRSALVPLRGYFRWLTKSSHLDHDPTRNMELPRPKHMLPRFVLTAREAEVVLRQPDIHSRLGVRDRAMLEVLYSTGVRRMELANLLPTDIDHRRELVFVNQGKWQKDRWVPISRRALDWIRHYANEVRPAIVVAPDGGTLFLTRNGLPFNESWLSTTISRYVRAANLGKYGSCHLFRHTLATLMLENGADIRFIQSMLGHADLKSTQIYAHVTLKQLKRVHRRTHPGCRASAEEKQSPAFPQRDDSQSIPAKLLVPADSGDNGEAVARYLLLRQRLTESRHQH